ncbi:transposase [Peribacillus tepidiphilus]|uniref:transposase n=1 Tax=Peribacillus tepidiphilus TaxID=2652445 RepID=UPI0035B5637B
MFGHIKGNRSFRRFSLRGLDKVYIEFGIVALAHNILKVAGILQLLSKKNSNNTKASGEKRIVFLHLLHFRDFLDNPICISATTPLSSPLQGSSIGEFFKKNTIVYFLHI